MFATTTIEDQIPGLYSKTMWNAPHLSPAFSLATSVFPGMVLCMVSFLNIIVPNLYNSIKTLPKNIYPLALAVLHIGSAIALAFYISTIVFIFKGAILLFLILLQSLQYIILAYLFRNISMSESCFFMPCAPQTISECEQAGTLFVGLVLFFGGEVAFPLVQHMRKERQKRRELERGMQDVGSRIERTEGMRVNSGITAEEGRSSRGQALGNRTSTL